MSRLSKETATPAARKPSALERCEVRSRGSFLLNCTLVERDVPGENRQMYRQRNEMEKNVKQITFRVLKLLYPFVHYKRLRDIPPQYLPSEIQELYEYIRATARTYLLFQTQSASYIRESDIQAELFFDVINRTVFLTDDQRARALCNFHFIQATGRFLTTQPWPHDCGHPSRQNILQYVALNCKHRYVVLGCGHKLMEFRCGHKFHSSDSLTHNYFDMHVCPQQQGPSTYLSQDGCHYEATMCPCDVFVKVLFPCGHLVFLPCDRLMQFDGAATYFYPEPSQDNKSFEAFPIWVFLADLENPFSQDYEVYHDNLSLFDSDHGF